MKKSDALRKMSEVHGGQFLWKVTSTSVRKLDQSGGLKIAVRPVKVLSAPKQEPKIRYYWGGRSHWKLLLQSFSIPEDNITSPYVKEALYWDVFTRPIQYESYVHMRLFRRKCDAEKYAEYLEKRGILLEERLKCDDMFRNLSKFKHMVL